ncbi:MAG: TraB/GumN family protein, partial [Bacteroidota bacterium]
MIARMNLSLCRRQLMILFHCLVISLCCLPSTHLNAQVDKTNYELLWEISGKDLPAAAYLFGTMHVRDVRAFEFSDSVLLMLDRCPQFAMEIHPDTLSQFMLDLYLNGDTTNVLKSKLSDTAYSNLNQVVLQKTGKPIDSMDIKDPFYIELLLSDFDEPEHTQKYPQFVDLYLYKQAMGVGNTVFGLEKISDYLSVTSSFFKLFEKGNYEELPESDASENDVTYESFIEIYQSGDLARLMAFIDQFPKDEDYNDELLIRRNYNMVDRFLDLARKQATFCAVGAAHLPAKEGMIDLLRKKGYRVRRVLPTFTGVAEEYAKKKWEAIWYTYNNPELAYEVATPGAPSKMLPKGAPDLFDLYIRSDLSEMNNFIFMAVEAGPGVDLNAAAYTDTVLQRWNEESPMEVLNSVPTQRDGQAGTRYRCRDQENSQYIFEIFLRQRMIYLFAVVREDSLLHTSNIQRFFDSIRFLDFPKDKMHTLTEPEGAFEIQLPTKARYRIAQKNVVYGNGLEGDINLHSYVAVDPKTEFSYLVRYNNYSPGIIISNPEEVLESSVNTFKTLWGDEQAAAKKITVEGFPGLDIMIDRGEVWVYLRHIIRGNRMYLIMAAVPPNIDFPVVAPIFNSFKFLPFQRAPLVSQSLEAGRFQIDLPDLIVRTAETQSYYRVQDVKISAQDTLSGTLFELSEYEYSPYLSRERFDTIKFSVMNSTRILEGQINHEDLQFQGVPAIYMTTDDNLKEVPTHRLFFFRDRYFYELMIFPVEAISREEAFTFFNSFRFLKTVEPLPENGVTLLFDDLASPNLAKRRLAKATVDHFYFDVNSLPNIYRILELDFPGDTLGELSIHQMMLREFTYNKDEGTLPFLVKLFQQKAHDSLLQVAILETIAEMKTKEAFGQFFGLAGDFRKDQYAGYIYKDLF